MGKRKSRLSTEKLREQSQCKVKKIFSLGLQHILQHWQLFSLFWANAVTFSQFCVNLIRSRIGFAYQAPL